VCSFRAADSECKDHLETGWYAHEGKKKKKSARGRRKEEEWKTSAEAIGGASAAAVTFSQGAFHLFS
jgi:hypothetical protein